VGASLLRYALHGTPPALGTTRVEYSTDLLFNDLERQGIDGLVLERNQPFSIPGLTDAIAPILVTNGSGRQFIVGLYGPLTPDEPCDEALRDLKEFGANIPVILEDELVVRRNLPTATARLLELIGAAGKQ